MTYAIEVKLMVASELVQREEGEPLDDYNERMDTARGQSLFRLTILDCSALEQDSAAAFVIGSPFFGNSDEDAKWSLLARSLKEAKKRVVARERAKVQARN